MKEENLNSWEEFISKADSLFEERNNKRQENELYISNYLFRGQSNSDWSLSTTLERFTDDLTSLKEYYQYIHAVKPQIETFTNRVWEIMTPPQYSTWLKNNDNDLFMAKDLSSYQYQIYLRHHGFPSPLLDWTRSPYIAAFFAFRNLNSKSEYVSIYVYMEYTGGGKSFSSNKPYITAMGPYIRSHERHFLQQCEYTLCTINKDDGECYYAPHHDFTLLGNQESDLLWKFNIPTTERIKVLKLLDRFNLNAFSLFGNEESLMETVSLREHRFRE